MRTFCTIACAMLLAGCTSATMQQSLLPTRQEFGYPDIASQPLPPSAPAPAATEAAPPPAVPAGTAADPSRPDPSRPNAASEKREAPYDETKDPIMRALVEQATKPVDEDLAMSDGKLLLPPPARLDVIDTRDISNALRSEAAPAS